MDMLTVYIDVWWVSSDCHVDVNATDWPMIHPV